MEQKEKKASRMSVPQFGEWDQDSSGAESSYTVAFTKARANRKHHKTDLIEVKRQSIGNDRGHSVNDKDNHRKKHDHKEEKNEPAAPVKKASQMSVPQFGEWNQGSSGAKSGYTVVFTKARVDKKHHKTDLTTKRQSVGNNHGHNVNNKDNHHKKHDHKKEKNEPAAPMKKVSRMSVPQFGEWDQGSPGAKSGYTVVFTKAREDKKHHKTDLIKVKRKSIGNDHEHNINDKDNHHMKHDYDEAKNEPTAPMKKASRMSVPQFGEWDQGSSGAESGYTMVFTKARADRKHYKSDLIEVKHQSVKNDHGHTVNEKDNHYKKHDHDHKEKNEVVAPMGRNKILRFFMCCVRP